MMNFHPIKKHAYSNPYWLLNPAESQHMKYPTYIQRNPIQPSAKPSWTYYVNAMNSGESPWRTIRSPRNPEKKIYRIPLKNPIQQIIRIAIRSSQTTIKSLYIPSTIPSITIKSPLHRNPPLKLAPMLKNPTNPSNSPNHEIPQSAINQPYISHEIRKKKKLRKLQSFIEKVQDDEFRTLRSELFGDLEAPLGSGHGLGDDQRWGIMNHMV